jgi:hypothetical protein
MRRRTRLIPVIWFLWYNRFLFSTLVFKKCSRPSRLSFSILCGVASAATDPAHNGTELVCEPSGACEPCPEELVCSISCHTQCYIKFIVLLYYSWTNLFVKRSETGAFSIAFLPPRHPRRPSTFHTATTATHGHQRRQLSRRVSRLHGRAVGAYPRSNVTTSSSSSRATSASPPALSFFSGGDPAR